MANYRYRSDGRLLLFTAVTVLLLVARPVAQESPPDLSADVMNRQEAAVEDRISQIEQADLYVKVIGGAVAAVVAILGLPFVLLNTKKARAEIRKLEAEAKKIEKEAPQQTLSTDGINVALRGDANVINIIAGP